MTTQRKPKSSQLAGPAATPGAAEDLIPSAPIEVVQAKVLEAIERGEVDIQIKTAKAFPRDVVRFLKNAETMATADEDVAESCLYNRPVGKKKDDRGRDVVEYASGMSIRMAEIAASTFQNIRVYAVLIENQERFVRARGMAFDLENNYASSSEAIESTVTKTGLPYSERMRAVVAKACLAKARRDAIFQVIPRGLLKPVELKIREILVGDRKALADRRKKALAWVDEMKIDRARVFAALGISGEKGLDVRKLELLTGIRTAIRDGDVTIEEAFPLIPGIEKKADGAGTAKPLFSAPGNAPANSTASPPSGTTGAPAGTSSPEAGSTPPAKQYTSEERQKIVDEVKNTLLDLPVAESKAFAYVKGLNLVPPGVDELFALPTVVLDNLRAHLSELGGAERILS